jgi:hypothetical protein
MSSLTNTMKFAYFMALFLKMSLCGVFHENMKLESDLKGSRLVSTMSKDKISCWRNNEILLFHGKKRLVHSNLALYISHALRGGSPSKRPDFIEESELEERKKELKKKRRLKKKTKELKLMSVRIRNHCQKRREMLLSYFISKNGSQEEKKAIEKAEVELPGELNASKEDVRSPCPAQKLSLYLLSMIDSCYILRAPIAINVSVFIRIRRLLPLPRSRESSNNSSASTAS